MSAIPLPTEEECYLIAILDDPSGIELAEFCIAEDQLVLTDRGHVPIQHVRVGDEVLTHMGRWRRVTAVHDRGVKPVVKMKGVGHHGLLMTPDHQLYSRRARQGLRSVEGHRDVFLEPAEWLQAQDVEFGGKGRIRNTRYATPSNVQQLAMPGKALDEDFLWLWGRWIADGSLSAHSTAGYRISWAVRDRDVAEVEERLRLAGIRFTTHPTQSAKCVQIQAYDKDLHDWLLAQSGKRAENKHLPAWVFGMEEWQRRALLEGYLSGDGYQRDGGAWQVGTVSRALAFDIRVLAAGLGYSVSIKVEPGGAKQKFGTTVQARDCYGLTLTKDGWSEDDGTLQWSMWKSREDAGQAHVWDLSVEEDHSFVVEGVVVHNCWIDEEQEDGCFRLWDFQWPWYRDESVFQIDWAGRSLGKSVGITMRAFAFPFNYPGQEMLITAPELNHLRPVTDKLEHQILTHRLSREMLPKQRGNGINHQPQFQAHFINNARIVSRLPQRSGRGVKGCVGPGALVLTRRGQVPIEEVQVGDEVLSHNGWWRKVLQVVEAHDVDGYRITGGGHRGFEVSANHRLLTRQDRTKGHGRRDLTDPDWAIVESPLGDPDLTHHYLGSPTSFPAEPIPLRLIDPAMAWVAGRYVADGYLSYQVKAGTRTSGRIHIIAPEKKRQAMLDGMTAAGLRPSAHRRANGTWNVECSDTELADLFEQEFGRHAGRKTCPAWVLGAREDIRQAFLNGYLAGNGHWDEKRSRWTVGTASKQLAVQIRLLGQTLGWSASLSWVDPKVSEIAGRPLKSAPQRSFRVTLSGRGIAATSQFPIEAAWQKVRSVEEVHLPVAYDLVVEHDHSYVADGIFHHNQHPLVIEADEMQDYPENGWIELIETMKHYVPGAQWRCHGVSNGLRDRYYKYTMGEDADLPFKVHRYMAMHRPSWSAPERQSKIAIYGGTEDNIDYRRNIYGDHGDITNPLFVLHRLMACVRAEESPWATEYNENVYSLIKVNDELLQSGAQIETLVDLPGIHLDDCYTSFWGGMDVGFTRDPSELLIWGELEHPRAKGKSYLRLLLRLHMMRVSASNQAEALRHVMEFYGRRLRRVALDKTGNGLPLWQEMDPAAVGTSVHLRRTPEHLSQKIVGYGFSQKVAVEFDDRELKGKERAQDALIEKNVVDFASDELRKLVDTDGLELPWDRELLTEWQGQEIQYVRDEGSAAGHKTRRYGGGSFHTLDAAKMMIAGRNLAKIESILNEVKKMPPRLDRIGFM